ncbi:NAD(P)/FAD-dependent oxidoreductase [Devosia sp.]|uniref:NAD(P)/FAD-dependent oxidoreductase n=1 Tax=Devosia sp. TaxID=1871048 RepID=UPI003A59956A
MNCAQPHLPPSRSRKIAVIGSGIAGLSAAWMLGGNHEVVIYEAEKRLGGHAHTVDVPTGPTATAVDTGFIVYNEGNYPNLVALFDHLGVRTQPSEMSFSASLDNGRLEYSSSAIMAQPSNLLSARFWRMLRDLTRFYRDAPGLLSRTDLQEITLGEFLDHGGYAQCFIDDHLLPIGAAIWSASSSQMRDYPLFAFIRFFESHGLLKLARRPLWRTVTGGSRRYVERLAAQTPASLRLGCGARRIVRDAEGVLVTDAGGHSDRFDEVVIATHADQALHLLADPDQTEAELLGAFHYTLNRAVLHTDPSLMPRRRLAWSSWNYLAGPAGPDDALCVTYWMNRLQNLDRRHPLFVTLNPHKPIAPEQILGSFVYRHPLFDRAALKAQQQLWRLNANRKTWFCGSYFGYGFHEDALQSGLAIAEALGGLARPWSVPRQSDRIASRPAMETAF